MNIDIPEELGPILRDFTVAVLASSPSNILDFAADYFTKARRETEASTLTKGQTETYVSGIAEKEHEKSQTNGILPGKSKVPMYIIVDDDEEAREPDPEELKIKTAKNKPARRGSVSAERYDPEADDASDESKVVHEKTREQRERLSEAVAGILLFQSLDTAQLGDVVDAMFEKKVHANEVVIKQGDDGDNFYVIDRGRFGVLVGSGGEVKRVHQFDNCGSFGELALMYNMPRSASIVAETEGVVWAMDRQSFRRIVLRAAFKKRKLYEQLLRDVPILNSLDEYERMNVADALSTRSYKDGEVIIKQGEKGDGMYFIEDGTVRVTVKKDGKEQELVRLHKGKYFGEVALLENTPRTASVYAVENIKLAFLERSSFERLMGPCLNLMKRKTSEYKKHGSGK